MELRLTIETDGNRRDVSLEADPAAPVAAATDAIAAALGLTGDDRLSLFNRRTGQWLRNDESIATEPVRTGDELLISAYTGSAGPELATQAPSGQCVCIVGGPNAGRWAPLGSGHEVTVGRDAECTIQLTDPSASGRHLVIRDESHSLKLADLGSTNGTGLEGIRLGAGASDLGKEQIVQVGRSLLVVRDFPDTRRELTTAGSVPFNRKPRIVTPAPSRSVPVTFPTEPPPPPSFSPIATLLPVLVGGLIFGVMLALGMNASLLVMSVGFMLLGPIVGVWTYVSARRVRDTKVRDLARTVDRELASLERRLKRAQQGEVVRLRDAAPDAAALVHRAMSHRESLWERRASDSDFLEVRLGHSDQRSDVALLGEIPPSAEERVNNLVAAHARLPAIPRIINLRALGTVSIVGVRTARGLASWMITQVAVLHSPRDVAIGALIGPQHLPDWEWLKWLPHTERAFSPTQHELLTVDGPATTTEWVDALLALSRQRRDASTRSTGSTDIANREPSVVVLIDARAHLDRPKISEVMRHSAETGIAVVWLDEDDGAIPGESSAVVACSDDPAALKLTILSAGTPDVTASCDGVDLDTAHRIARALSPLRDISAEHAASVLPDHVSIADLAEFRGLDADAMRATWAHDEESVTAPIGMSSSGSFVVDLVRDGPHALVAGTTGSGKSELLQTLVVALAARYPPTRINFLLIDYKGGAAFTSCVGLPHTVGFVTDLDARMTERTLLSLRAEVRRREALLGDLGASSLGDVEQSDQSPPRLVILVDEFRFLTEELPDFVEGLVDIAARGRSLGLHLVLATQRPAGVVSPNIRANTNLRIALRVQDESESSDVISSPAAAHIDRLIPGRAFARTGVAELTPFQAAYGGGQSPAHQDVVRVTDFGIGLARAAGERVGLNTPRQTDLERIVDTVAQATATLGLPPPRRPWLPPLPSQLAPSALEEMAASPSEWTVPIALADDPTRQMQEVVHYDAQGQGNFAVFGGPKSGRTSLLRLIAASLAKRRNAEDLHLYAIDFGIGGLRPLNDLRICGAVIGGDDQERMERLFAILQQELASRRRLIGSGSEVPDPDARNLPQPPGHVPRIVVLLDGYEAFASTYERVNFGELVESFQRLVAEGPALGIQFIFSAERRTHTALTSAVAHRIVLRLASADDYGSLGLNLRELSIGEMPPGRGFMPDGREIQCAVLGPDGSSDQQATAIADIAAIFDHGPDRPPPIEPLPRALDALTLPAPHEPLQAYFGIEDLTRRPVEMSLADGHYLVAGPYMSGRSTTLSTVMRSLHRYADPPEVHLLMPRPSSIAAEDGWASIGQGIDGCEASLAALVDRASSMQSVDTPIVVLVDDAEEFLEGAAAGALAALVRMGRSAPVRIIAAAEAQAARRAYGGWLSELRKARQGLLLAPDVEADGELLSTQLPRRIRHTWPAGRGYAVNRGVPRLVQVAASEAQLSASLDPSAGP